MSFRNVLLADIVRSDSPITYGVVKPGDEGNVFLVRSTDVNNNSIDLEKLRTITTEVATQYKRTELMGGELLISLVGNPGNLAIVPDSLAGANIARQVALIRLDAQKANRRFVYYYFQAGEGKEEIDKRIVGSVQSVINLKDLRTVPVKLPSLEYQKSIAHILSTLDEKIEVNNQINKTLEAMAQALFKQWFIDFEFPNENGEPYKSSGGEMVESELGLIPKGWEVSTLGEIIEILDSKRIPLSKNEREKRDKIYPYYGAAALMDYVDDYIFEGVHVLMGEDGTVIDDNGYPILQYVWGKFWVNNHAHVLKGVNGVSEEFLLILLRNLNIKSAVTGAVQLKINQQNMKALKVVLPIDFTLIEKYTDLIEKSYEKLRNCHDENAILINLRDALLPKLMSGEIRVPIDAV